jgi:hypothetical protein
MSDEMESELEKLAKRITGDGAEYQRMMQECAERLPTKARVVEVTPIWQADEPIIYENDR